jgi:pimeloyl-ACP methyl ester carboxylesterase
LVIRTQIELLARFGVAHHHRPPTVQIDPNELSAVILTHQGPPSTSGLRSPSIARDHQEREAPPRHHIKAERAEAVTSMAGESPTIVLVHGAWADATGFDAEVRALRERGFTVVGFANPLRDLAADARYLVETLRSLTGPIVLVGHSYGGNVISVAAASVEQVKALVYLNGWMCDEGESQQELLEKFEGSLVGPSIRPVPFTAPDGSQGVDLYWIATRFTRPLPPTSTRRRPR